MELYRVIGKMQLVRRIKWKVSPGIVILSRWFVCEVFASEKYHAAGIYEEWYRCCGTWSMNASTCELS